MHVPRHDYARTALADAQEISALVRAARELGYQPLAVVAVHGIARCGLAPSGAALGDLLGKSERTGRRALQEYQEAARIALRGHGMAAMTDDETATGRPLTGHQTTAWPVDVGGMGGSQSINPSLPSDLIDQKAATAGSAGAVPRVSSVSDGFDLDARPPRSANATAASVLQALGVAPETVRKAMQHLAIQWRKYGRTATNPQGYARSIVERWLLANGVATHADLAAVSRRVASVGHVLAAEDARAVAARQRRGEDPHAPRPDTAARSVEDPPGTCPRCGSFTCHPSPDTVACENPACTWAWDRPLRDTRRRA